jgi:cytochrome d ubiquinol oxidase subunit I
MVGIGLLMLALVLVGNGMRHRGRVYESRAFLKLCEIAAPFGFVAVLAGWITTEVGRQPWTVYGLLRTTDSVTPSLTGANVLLSFAGYILVYLIIFPAGFVIMARIVRRGPMDVDTITQIESGRPAEPVLALSVAKGVGGERP